MTLMAIGDGAVQAGREYLTFGLDGEAAPARHRDMLRVS